MKKHRENDKERSSDCNNQPVSLSRTVRLRSPLPSPGPRLRSRSCTRERLAPASLQQTPPSSPPLDQQSPIDWSKINRGASQVTSAIDKAKANIEQQQPRQQQKSMLARLKSHLGEGSYWRQQQHQQQQSSDFSTTTARQSGPTAQKTTQESNYQPSPAAAAGQGSGQACQPASQPASEPGTSRRGPPREAKTAGPAWLKTLRKTKQ